MGIPYLVLAKSLLFSPVILLSWASVRYGGQKHSDPTLCAPRISNQALAGNPDFYGLGIRIGVYIQWGACLIANVCLASERRAMAGAYGAFTIALYVAL